MKKYKSPSLPKNKEELLARVIENITQAHGVEVRGADTKHFKECLLKAILRVL